MILYDSNTGDISTTAVNLIYLIFLQFTLYGKRNLTYFRLPNAKVSVGLCPELYC